MEGLIEEASEALEEESEPAILDVALIVCAQRVEHYEIAAYGNAVVIAQKLGVDKEAINLLKSTLDDEEKADRLLTRVCQKSVFPSIAEAVEV